MPRLLPGLAPRGGAQLLPDEGPRRGHQGPPADGPQLRVLLGQLESRDSDLRDELAAIRSHDGDRITWKRLLVFCDAMKVEAGELIASVYLARTAGPRVH